MGQTPVQTGNYRSPAVLMVGIVAMLLGSLLLSSRGVRVADGRLHILCSFLPVYVFTQNVVGNQPDVVVESMLPPGAGCPHDYSLRKDDVIRINRADLVILNGLGAEAFAEQLLRRKPRAQVITLSEQVQPIAGEDEGHEEHEEGHHHGEVNPHVWASPVEAARQVRELAGKLAAADPVHAKAYEQNGEAYARKLEALAERMRTAARRFASRNIVTFHDAFAYLARDLDLNVVATMTVDPQNGISAHQMSALAHAIREQHVSALFYEPAYSNSDLVAKRLAEQTGITAYPLNPFNYHDGPPGKDAYERVMEQNLRVLERALGSQP